MFDCADQYAMTAALCAPAKAEQREVIGFRGSGRENDFIGVCANQCRDRFRRLANGFAGSPAHNMVAGVRVAERFTPARGPSFPELADQTGVVA